MKDSISFVRNILDLTESGKLKWERYGRVDPYNETICFTVKYCDKNIIFQRYINNVETFVDVLYGFKWGDISVKLHRNETLKAKGEKRELILALEKIGFLLVPETSIPEAKKTILDDVLYVLYAMVGKKMHY